MKKLVLPAIFILASAFTFTSTSCNDKVCTKCTKIGDDSDTQEYCSSNEHDRNDWIVEQTHADYNCVTVDK